MQVGTLFVVGHTRPRRPGRQAVGPGNQRVQVLPGRCLRPDDFKEASSKRSATTALIRLAGAVGLQGLAENGEERWRSDAWKPDVPYDTAEQCFASAEDSVHSLVD